MVAKRKKSTAQENAINPNSEIAASRVHIVQNLVEDLNKRKQDFKTVAENAPDIICRFDQSFAHLYVNPAITKATGYPREAFIGKTPHDIMPPQFAQKWVDNLRFVFESGEQTTMEFSFPNPEGERQYQSLLVPEFNAIDDISSVLSISRDITEMKQEAKQRDDLLGIISHELKTPVTSLKAFTQVLHAKLTRAGEVDNAAHLSKMENQINKLSRLIAELLDITRVQSGRMQVDHRAFDFNELVVEVVESMQLTTTKHKIMIDGQASSQVVGDRDRISQVLINLLSNAIKYSPKADKIIVGVSSAPENLLCCVEDFGVGIPQDKLEQVFERFFRVTGPTHQSFSGLGLGLYISAEIVRRHQGELWVESEMGKGSTFCFTLPIKKTN